MDNVKFEVLSNIMVERNIILDILQILSRELEMKEIDPNLFKIIKAKYLAKLKSLDIQMSKSSRNLLCSKCERSLEDDEPTLSCIKCGFPFHQKHLNNSSILNENICTNCGSILRTREFDGFKSVELKKIQHAFKQLFSKISEIDVKIEGKMIKLKYNVPSQKENEIIKKGKDYDRCPNCQQTINKEWRFCKKCGFLLEEYVFKGKNTCKNCGTLLDPSWRFCKWCGTPTSS